MKIPNYIPIDQATKHYPISRAALTQAIQAGKMRAVKVNGSIAVAEEDMKILAIALDDDLLGKPIRALEAAEKYNVTHASVNRWVNAGYVPIIEQRAGYLVVDEAHIKRCAEIFNQAMAELDSAIRAGFVLKRTMRYFK